MREPYKKAKLVSVFSSVLMLTFYGHMSQDSFWALALSSLSLVFFGGLIYFLRAWLTAAWVRTLVVALAAVAAQAAWIRQGLEPWWALAVLSFLLPTTGEIRQPGSRIEFVMSALILEASALCFFAARSALELTASRFFWEQPAGHWSLLGLIALTVSLLETRGEPRGA